MSKFTRHNLIQNTPEWDDFRANHYGASEAAAMMGEHPTIKRSELIRMKATGTSKEFSDWVQENLFDKGHRIEAAMRPRAVEIIGEDLYPVTASLGIHSASYDGLSMLADESWECKSINESIRIAETAADLPLYFHIQLEQQLMVRNGNRALFSAGDIDEDGNIIEEKHLWYEANLSLREKIVKGWERFRKDVAAYEHVEIIEKPKGTAVLDLPAVMVNVSGQIAITDNLDKFSSALKLFVDTQLIREPKTDQDFADLEAQVKTLKKAEEALDSAEAHMLAQVDAVDTAKRTIDMLRKIARDNRLMAEKLVKTEKENIKTAAVMNARKLFMDHISALNAEIRPAQIEGVTPDFNGAAKNKRTMASLHDAIDTELARTKIEADAQSKDIRENLAHLTKHDAHRFLFNDLATIAHKAPDDFAALVAHRIGEHKAAEDARLAAERQRMQEQAEADARAKVEDEQRAEAERIRQQEEASTRTKVQAEKASEQPEAADIAQSIIDSAPAVAKRVGSTMRDAEPKPAESTETVLVIRSAHPQGFIRKMVADSLAKYGIVVDSVELDEVVV